MSRTLLTEILDCNGSYLNKMQRFVDSAGEPFLVVACIDSRLTGFLEGAMGLPRNRTLILRTAGNTINQSTRDALRTVVAALFLKNAREIFIVGHTDCAMARFQAAQAIDSFRAAGIPRSAFGDEDLRIWFGAFADVKGNVLQSIDFLRKCALIPRDIKIHGLVIDTLSGSLEVVLNGDLQGLESPASPAKAVPVEIPTQEESGWHPISDRPLPAAAKPDSVAAPKKTIIIPQSLEADARTGRISAADSFVELARKLKNFVDQERKSPQFERALLRIAADLKSERDPARFIGALQQIARDYESRYPELPALVEKLITTMETKGAASARLVELFRILLDSAPR